MKEEEPAEGKKSEDDGIGKENLAILEKIKKNQRQDYLNVRTFQGEAGPRGWEVGGRLSRISLGSGRLFGWVMGVPHVCLNSEQPARLPLWSRMHVCKPRDHDTFLSPLAGGSVWLSTGH